MLLINVLFYWCWFSFENPTLQGQDYNNLFANQMYIWNYSFSHLKLLQGCKMILYEWSCYE